nr:PREDICTED: uncharacterized protein LOC109645736 [Paralichthys olivaceus]
MFLLLSCWILAGITAEDEVLTHYKMTNSSICLNVTKPPPHTRASWNFGGNFIASKEVSNPNYAKKMEFNPSNLTLCIKELTDKDAGDYHFEYLDSGYKSRSEIHRVIVQDSVPRPVIQMSVLLSNLSAGLCSIAVNCSVQDEWVWAVCGEDRCRVSQSLNQKVNIAIMAADNWTVVCSGNNQVSANNVSANMSTTCFSKVDPELGEASQPLLTIVAVAAVCVSLIASIAFFVLRLFSHSNDQQRQTLVEEQPQPEPRVSTSSSSPSEAAYENVDAAQLVEELGSSPSQEVQTVYSVVQAANVTPPPVESDTLGEASHSEVITVYSVLQKPKTLKSQQHQQVT